MISVIIKVHAGKCYQLKPKTEVGNTNRDVDYFEYRKFYYYTLF